jgi:hypothetical protein
MNMLLWRTATAIALVCSLLAIQLNSNEVERVCQTVQAQLDRNEATLRHSLQNLILIRDRPEEARAQNVQGATYYSGNPVELISAINHFKAELATYSGDAC